MANSKFDDRRVWDRFWAEKRVEGIYPPVTDIVSELRKLVKDFRYKKILEIGAGTGRTGIRLAELGGDVVLLDYSVNSLRMMRGLVEQGKKDVKLLLANALSTPLADESFDIIIHQGLLEHFKSPFVLLNENIRLLKSGGYLLIDVPQTFHIYTLIKQALMLVNRWFGGWERQFTVDSLSNLVKHYGLRIVHVYGDWSRPGLFYKIVRLGLAKFSIQLPMYPKYFGELTEKFYKVQTQLRNKRIFFYSVLSVGIIAQKG